MKRECEGMNDLEPPIYISIPFSSYENNLHNFYLNVLLIITISITCTCVDLLSDVQWLSSQPYWQNRESFWSFVKEISQGCTDEVISWPRCYVALLHWSRRNITRKYWLSDELTKTLGCSLLSWLVVRHMLMSRREFHSAKTHA